MPVFFLAKHGQPYSPDNRPQQSDVASLKTTHERMLKAWSDRDIETIVEICNGAVGLVIQPLSPSDQGRRPLQEGACGVLLDDGCIHHHTYLGRLHGGDNTGVAWGHLVYTSKQKDGPQRMIYQRYVHTFAKRQGYGKR